MTCRALDLFCGAGGATKGLQRAGFHVTGVDIAPRPHYCGDAFVQADATRPPLGLSSFDFIWASPPCQRFSQMAATHRAQGFRQPPDLLTPILAMLRAQSVPWVVENVVGAGELMPGAIKLHGNMFGLRVHRPRLFLSSLLLLAPPPCSPTPQPVGVYDTRPRGKTHHRTRLNGNGKGRSEMRIARTLEEAQEAMGMDWADWHGTKEAIPPAYSEWIGRQALAAIKGAS